MDPDLPIPATPKPNSGQFKKGNKRRPGAGRKKGQVNATTKEMKQVLLRSMSLAGRKIRKRLTGKKGGGAVDYLVWLAEEEPSSYASLIGKLIPRQVEATVAVEGLGDRIREGRARARAALVATPKVVEVLPDGALVIEADDSKRSADRPARLDAAAD